MKIVVHKEDDALYIRLDDGEIVDSEEVSEGIILDFNSDGTVIGIEILFLSLRSPDTLRKIMLETV
ncbi:DUF2283 domain-containing protein [Gloeomargaritales cyanobacterium VI4D9]|nr:DUF2283 domain-containing protein [Gloeomargaritales cyanobacterium VI4D9]